MPNYKLDELLSMSGDEVRSIAQTLGIATKTSDSLQELAYMIIDEQAVAGSKIPVQKPKKQRTATKGTASASTAKKKSEPKKKDSDTVSEIPKEPTKKRTTSRRKTDDSNSTVEQPTEAMKPVGPLPENADAKGGAVDAVPETGEDTATPSRRRIRRPVVEEPAKPVETAPATAEDTVAERNGNGLTSVAEPTASEPVANGDWPESDFIVIQDIPALEAEDSEFSLTDSRPAETDLNTAVSASQKSETAVGLMRNSAKATEVSRGYAQPYDFGDSIISCGVLDTTSEGQSFLRSADYNYLPSPDDIYVSSQQIKYYGLKMGDVVECSVRTPRENEKYFPLAKVIRINGLAPEQVRDRLSFEHLTPLFPDEKFRLCKGDGSDSLSARIVDLFAPIGKGQRALLVAQPKTGKTMLMKSIANAIAANHPEAYLMMLLIDERPEEVTDMARTVDAEVIASTFDEPASNHVKIAGIVLEKAKRMVECGHDVVIFLDSITRLARAYNTVAPASGKILTGGVDANALQKPKRFFGAARNIEGGGSLTIIATALIDTGSKMDEVIFEEFKGTGNMELQLDRSLSNKRIFPAVNCVASSTRRDDLLLNKMTLDRMWVLRNHIAEMTPMESMNVIRGLMEKTRSNEEFLLSMNS